MFFSIKILFLKRIPPQANFFEIATLNLADFDFLAHEIPNILHPPYKVPPPPTRVTPPPHYRPLSGTPPTMGF